MASDMFSMQAYTYKVLTSMHRTQSTWEGNKYLKGFFDGENISLLVNIYSRKVFSLHDMRSTEEILCAFRLRNPWVSESTRVLVDMAEAHFLPGEWVGTYEMWLNAILVDSTDCFTSLIL